MIANEIISRSLIEQQIKKEKLWDVRCLMTFTFAILSVFWEHIQSVRIYYFYSIIIVRKNDDKSNIITIKRAIQTILLILYKLCISYSQHNNYISINNIFFYFSFHFVINVVDVNGKQKYRVEDYFFFYLVDWFSIKILLLT